MSYQEPLAKGLGYLVGFGSIMLYTPIAVRLLRQKHADGLVMSTWWLKVCSYLLSDVYYFRKGYDLSTFSETLVITIEALVVLVLVAYYQKRFREKSFWVCGSTLGLFAVWERTIAPETLVATGQLGSAFVNVFALIPQFWHNYCTNTKGDYSPLTAGLALAGCGIRIFTTITLNGSDPVLMMTFLVAILTNAALLVQILYYGVAVEGLSFWQVLVADVVTAQHRVPIISTNHHDSNIYEENGGNLNSAGTYGGVYEIGNSSNNLLERRPSWQQTRPIT